MGIQYRSTCGCLISAPEPSLSEYSHQDQYERAHDIWNQGWQEAIAEHHVRCCEAAQQGDYHHCLEGEPRYCPQLEVGKWGASHAQAESWHSLPWE